MLFDKYAVFSFVMNEWIFKLTLVLTKCLGIVIVLFFINRFTMNRKKTSLC